MYLSNSYMYKKANATAVILMSITIMSSLFAYFNVNSIFVDSTEINRITFEKEEYSNSMESIIVSTVHNFANRGFSNESKLWFENGPYPPPIEEVDQNIENELTRLVEEYITRFNNDSSQKIIKDEFNLEAIFDVENEIFDINVTGLKVSTKEENFYYEEKLPPVEYDFKNLIIMYKNYKRWNDYEGTLIFNEISDSIKAHGFGGCSCYSDISISNFDLSQLPDTGVDKNFVYEVIDNEVSKLNSQYFDEYDSISCEYEISNERIFEANVYQKNTVSREGFQCNPSGTVGLYIGDDTYIWDEQTTIVDLSTASYEKNPPYYYLNRPLSIEPDLLSLIQGETKKETSDSNLESGSSSSNQAVVAIGKKIPHVAFSLDITCKDSQNVYFNGDEIKNLEIDFGYRMNILKAGKLYGISLDDLYDVKSCPGGCKEAKTCDYNCEFLNSYDQSSSGSCGSNGCAESETASIDTTYACINGEETNTVLQESVTCNERNYCVSTGNGEGSGSGSESGSGSGSGSGSNSNNGNDGSTTSPTTPPTPPSGNVPEAG